MQKLFDNITAFLKNSFELQECGYFSSVLPNNGYHFPYMGGIIGHKFEPKWHVPV